MSVTNTATARPAALACLECRRTHLKCDGIKPACTRCTSRGISCDYTPSRRGLRTRAKRPAPDPKPIAARTSPYYISEPSTWDPRGSVAGLEDAFEVHDAFSQPSLGTPQSMLPALLDGSVPRPIERHSYWQDDEQLVNLYYLNFHNAHPILLSKSLYWKRGYPPFLKAVVEFIGSHFSPGIQPHSVHDAATRELEKGQQNSPEMVQARLLYTIALFARNEVDEGRRMLTQAIDIALELGMHQREFAASHAGNSAAEGESMRRTWYELYVTDGCIAAFQRKASFRTYFIAADVLLPCDDGVIDGDTYPCVTASRADFDASVFSNDEMVFSSFCYRIEAVRLLGRILTLTSAHGVHRDRVQAVDNALAAFIHHLPTSKSEPEIINTYGELDELMFQAHVVIQYATILLHFPRSDLSSPVSFTNVVPGSNATKLICPCERQRVHSIKAIEASKSLSMLAAFRAPVQSHSPFFVYALALGAVVQLSVSAIHSKSSRHCLEQHYDRVKLMLGVLKSFGKYWFVAGVVLRALNKMALVVFQPPSGVDVVEQTEGVDNGPEACSFATPTSGFEWPEDFDFQDIQEIVGMDSNDFCV
jgi:hypothetical protein